MEERPGRSSNHDNPQAMSNDYYSSDNAVRNDSEYTSHIHGSAGLEFNVNESTFQSLDEDELNAEEPNFHDSDEDSNGHSNENSNEYNNEDRRMQIERDFINSIRELDEDELNVEEEISEDDEDPFDSGENENIFSRLTFEVNVSSMQKKLSTNSDFSYLWKTNESSIYKIPILYIEEKVMFPGFEEKIRIIQPRFRNALLQSYSTIITETHNSIPKTIGIVLVSNPPDGFISSVGVLAEVLKVNNFFDSELPTDGILKTKNRFFVIQTYTENDGIPFADVRIIKEEKETSFSLPCLFSSTFFSPLAAIHSSRSGRRRKEDDEIHSSFLNPNSPPFINRTKRKRLEEEEEEENGNERYNAMKDDDKVERMWRKKGRMVDEEREGRENEEDEEQREGREERGLSNKDFELFENILNDDCNDANNYNYNNNNDDECIKEKMNDRYFKTFKWNGVDDMDVDNDKDGEEEEEEENGEEKSNEKRIEETTQKDESLNNKNNNNSSINNNNNNSNNSNNNLNCKNNNNKKNKDNCMQVLYSSYMYEKRMMLKKSTWGEYSLLWKNDWRRVCLRAQLTSSLRCVHKLTDIRLLMDRITDMLEHLRLFPKEMLSQQNPHDAESAESFSFSISSLLPIRFLLKQELLEKENSWLRMIHIIHIIHRMVILKCKFCKREIAKRNDQSQTGSAYSLNAYSLNEDASIPACYHLCYGEGLRRNTLLKREESWYKGYACSAAFCKYCGCEIGKHFLAVDAKASPPSFWALIKSRVVNYNQETP